MLNDFECTFAYLQQVFTTQTPSAPPRFLLRFFGVKDEAFRGSLGNNFVAFQTVHMRGTALKKYTPVNERLVNIMVYHGLS